MIKLDVSTKTYPNHFSLIDNNVNKEILCHKWFVHKSKNNKLYVVRDKHLGMKNGKQICERIWLHRLINKTPSGFDTDHINGNSLDNRQNNLRTCTRSKNNFNTGLWSHNTSGYKGVTWDKFRKKWVAQMHLNSKHIYLGRFEKIEDAVKSRRDAEEIYAN